jgi:hypothetical protein
MHGGIAVDFACRRLENLRLESLAESEHVDRSVHAGLGRLHGIELVVNRRGRAGEVVDLVNLNIQWKGYVVTQQFEMRAVQKVCDILLGSSKEVVDT